ncbi:MAG: GNAT family N-acetyltransferase [Actinobacteria bacterium]|nr:GNAT family N-acetyltransferase [Actinomycetota bacterium]
MQAQKALEALPTRETDRLILRKMTLEDAEAVFTYASDPEVTRYVLWETHRSLEDSRAFLELAISKYKSGGEPDWGIVYKGNHRFVGACGIVSWEPDHARAELGYALSRGYWGRGFMVEAVRAMISFGFERMGLNRLAYLAAVSDHVFRRHAVRREVYGAERRAFDLLVGPPDVFAVAPQNV